jgi:hypothetical protein
MVFGEPKGAVLGFDSKAFDLLSMDGFYFDFSDLADAISPVNNPIPYGILR